MDCLDFGQLPFEIRSKLAELEVELSEGDITEKGYQKKKAKLLAPYIESAVSSSQPLTSTPNVTQSSSGLHIPCGAVQLPGLTGSALDRRRLQLRSPASSGEDGSVSGPDDNSNDCENGSPLHRPQNRRYIREDGRYRSENCDRPLSNDIREEAVKEALSRNHRQRPEALLPNKRRENGAATYHGDQDDSEDDLSSEASGPGLQPLGPGPSHSSLTTPVPPPASSNYQNDVTTPTSSVAAVTNHLPTHPQTNGTAENFNHMLPVTDFSSGLHLNKPRLDNNLAPMSSTSTYIPEPVGMCSADSFEQLAAQAAAQLNLVSPEFASVPQQPQYQTDSDLPPTSHGQPSMWNKNAPVSSSSMYSNVSPEHFTSTPHKTPVFGGVNVLPPNTTIPASLFPPTSAGHYDPSSPWLESGQHMESTFSPAMNLPSIASFQNSDAAEQSDHASSHRDSGVSQPDRSQLGLICPNRVSEKIQQLVNTLKRPKRRPLPEYFLDEEDQVLVRPVVDPSAPRPHGPPSQPLRGEELVVPSGLPRNLESALQRYAGLSCKTPVLTCLDVGGRPTQVLTYAKLLQRSIRIAYMLLNKVGHRGEQSLKPGDRVALVYANNEPISFFAAFYGCILASVVPIAIEVPSVRRDASCQSMGFLLSSQNARIVLASEQCYKALQRGPNGDIVTHAGWPNVMWINTDHHGGGSKPPKDWTPPDRLPNEESLYMEYTFSKDGSIHGVMISRRAALAHCRALTVACHYSEEDVVVCVVDCRREIGLWHAVLTSIFNGLHVIFVPYSVMQVDPGSWLRMVTKYRASVAIVKSRDMHWALLAERDHPNVNLSSLRMLLVADGSNPWSLNSCDSFVQKFRSRGFRAEAICPAAGSPETLTLCLRRPAQVHAMGTATNGKVFSNGLPHTLTQSSAASAAASSAVRGVISIHSLTYGVIRVDSEDSLTSLTLQDCGQVLPGASAVVVRLGPKPVLCRTDELGEICLTSDYTGTGYWGLRGQTGAHFHVEPLNEDGTPVNAPGTVTYTRSGYLGFPGPASSGSLIFVCGSVDGLLTVAGRRHNADDVIATVLAVQPTKIVYRGRIAVFSIELLKDERVVIIAELRQGYSDEAAFTWMSLVLQAVDSIHQVSVYCLALVQQNTLPRTPFGGINCHAVKRLFSDGQLHPTALLLCPHSAIQNLPQPRQLRPNLVGPSAIMCGQVVQGVRMAEASGRPIPVLPTPSASGSQTTPDGRLLVEILIWRAIHTPDDRLFTVYNQKGQEASSLTCAQLLRRAERLGCLLQDKAKATVGTIVALLYPPGTEILCAFYACQLIGAIPVPIRPPRLDQSGFNNSSSTPSTPGSVAHLSGPVGSGSSTGLSLLGLGPSAGNQSSSGSTESWANINFRPAAPSFEASLELVWNIVKHSNASVVFTQQPIVKLLKSKEATSRIPFNHWPPVLDSEESFRKKISPLHQTPCVEQSVAYLDFAASTTGTVTGIRVTHQVVQAMCRAQKVQCEFYPTREVVLSLDPYSGLGFTLWALTSVHCGHHSILVPPSVTEAVPDLWLTVCSQRKVRDAFCSHYTMELATRHMTKQLSLLKPRDLSLSSLRSLVVVAEERPRIHLTATFTKLFSSFGLMSRAVSTSFGCRVNLAISLQGASSPESTTVYVDRISLRNDRVKMLEKGSPHSLCLMESGKLLPGVRVAIANPDTLGQCADSQLGEIWVSSPHNSTELLGPFDNASLSRAPGTTSQPVPGLNAADSLCARLVTGDTERVYARTGFLGFVRRTELTQSDGELHDAIFVVGSLEEAIMLRGMRFHPVDIENTVMRAHKKICECAVFTWSNLLVVVAELVGEENEAMDLVHPITAHVLTEHQLIVGVVVVTDPGTVPVNPCGEKQRILLRDSFVNDKLDPIYVSYNM
ncbi:hypothetical protein CRM22_007221 [Opisthorchis felineus]|uniref:DMAP1-binding domain-containing protein n=1 Tax=Opisthorchis felineus TaxID=147828 RepID=A0A4S2LGV6_OPIFE|nr:hypothetical protein CRM22_007221 [Opisthorchis felineus]